MQLTFSLALFGSFSLVIFLGQVKWIDCSRKRRSPAPEPVAIPKFDVYTMESLVKSLPPQSHRLKPLVVDCFEYVNEPITIFRLNYLKDVVDLFILMEIKGHDASEFLMDKDRSKIIGALEHEKKLVKMKIDEFPYEFKYRQNTTRSDYFLFRMTPYHFRDTKLKHAGLLHLAKYKYLVDSFFHEFKKKFSDKSYILIFGRHNEIPRKEIVAGLPQIYGHPALSIGLRLEMATFYYSFKWTVPEERVRSTTIFQDTGFQDLASLVDTLWFGSEKLPLMFRSGWRCSFFQSSNIVESVIRTYYPEYDRPDIVNRTWLDECIVTGQDLFKRRYVFISPYDGAEGFPNCKSCSHEVANYETFHLPHS